MFLKKKKNISRNKALEISNQEFKEYLNVFFLNLEIGERNFLLSSLKNTLNNLTLVKQYPIYLCERTFKNDLRIFFNSISKTDYSLDTLKIATFISKTFFIEENPHSNKVSKFLKKQGGNLVGLATLIVTILGIIFKP